jgi:hypothetical protein
MDNPLPFNQAVIDEVRANGGRVSRLSYGNPLLLPTTTGAKSGLPRTSPVGYSTQDDRLIIAATDITDEGSYPTGITTCSLIPPSPSSVGRSVSRHELRSSRDRSASASLNSTPRSCRSTEHTLEEPHAYRP